MAPKRKSSKKVKTAKPKVIDESFESLGAKSSETLVPKLSSFDFESEIVEEVYIEKKVERKTSPYMSIYEYTALIRNRALQLGTPGAEPKIDIPYDAPPEDYDPINIATKEVDQKLVSLVIRRTTTSGTTEDWHPRDMIFPRI